MIANKNVNRGINPRHFSTSPFPSKIRVLPANRKSWRSPRKNAYSLRETRVFGEFEVEVSVLELVGQSVRYRRTASRCPILAEFKPAKHQSHAFPRHPGGGGDAGSGGHPGLPIHHACFRGDMDRQPGSLIGWLVALASFVSAPESGWGSLGHGELDKLPALSHSGLPTHSTGLCPWIAADFGPPDELVADSPRLGCRA